MWGGMIMHCKDTNLAQSCAQNTSIPSALCKSHEIDLLPTVIINKLSAVWKKNYAQNKWWHWFLNKNNTQNRACATVAIAEIIENKVNLNMTWMSFPIASLGSGCAQQQTKAFRNPLPLKWLCASQWNLLGSCAMEETPRTRTVFENFL